MLHKEVILYLVGIFGFILWFMVPVVLAILFHLTALVLLWFPLLVLYLVAVVLFHILLDIPMND